jgi:hypothetical protein
MRSRNIKSLEEFESINEGLLSSLLTGVKNFFTSKKGKVENILKKIRDARHEEVANTISVEKEIQGLSKENTPEYRFTLTNLRRQSRTYAALKGHEINSLAKEARVIMEEDPKLEAFFASEMAKIEVETKEKLLKNLGGISDAGFLNQLNAEFDSLVKDANRKSSFYEEYKERPSYMPSVEVPSKMTDDVLSFLNMPTKDAVSFTRSLDETNLNKYYVQIRDFFFDLEDKYSTAIERIRRDKKMAEKQGDDWLIPSLEKEELNVKYHLRKNIDKLRARVNTLEREMKNRRNVTQTV